MNPLKKLAGETVIYGVSSILGRLLNWLLVPLYTNLFVPEDYGIVTNLMSYVAILLVVLTYGMETGYFRFASKETKSDITFSTGFISLIATSILFWIIVAGFLNPLSVFLEVPENKSFIVLLALTLGFDAITALPFAKLRKENRAVRYAGLKLINIGVNLGINLFFLLLCPWIHNNFPEIPITTIWNPEFGIGYIFMAIFVSSFTNLLLLLPDILKVQLKLDQKLLLKILAYSSPILVVSICGTLNINLDKMIMPELIPESQNPFYQTGIYGANYKLAVIMTLFIQAFRYSFEPFFFAQAKEQSSKQVYADVLKYFVILGLIIFLGVMFYLDIVKILIDSRYHEGLGIVPYVLLANLFFGIFFSLSLWYKLTDKTRFGAYIAIVGVIVTLVLNILLVPIFGYMGAAYSVLACFLVITAISYIAGQKYYPVPYDLKGILFYLLLAAILFTISTYLNPENQWMKMAGKTPLLLLFIIVVVQKEHLWSSLGKIVGINRKRK
ncbi:polysaccharide biosynthesis C-terminal domain-containing protein [Labilibaculum sp.]|uniref:lipopolysaccharide biosynthesis protein n=1 Tax=Labilibaculum sp. TaxID=2060723 RepID=UPI002AA76122|nr:polysaccharide biosynthesis C-terminal domain-containing protein [Labilibaculum sp.]MBN2595526.1 polysaccharide biosynthesis protein [Marinifilaceae bacterium]